MCRKYAEAKGYQVVAELSEDIRGAKGSELDLDKLNQVLDMAAQGVFDVLVVREMDRLARDTWKQEYVRHELSRHGCTIDFVLYDFPPTPEGDFQRSVLAAIAELDAKKIAQRLQRGKRLKVQAGNVVVAGRPPYGYRITEVDGKATLAIQEDEAETVRLIYQWYTEGDGKNRPLGLNAITRKLNDLGIPTWGDMGRHRVTRQKTHRYGEWCRAVVSQILKNPTYAGHWQYGKSHLVKTEEGRQRRVYNPEEHIIDVTVPAIVDQETWEAAQERAEANRYKSGRRKYDYLLSGRAKCGLCARNIRGTSTGGTKHAYLYYRCAGSQNDVGYTDHCELPIFSAPWVDGTIWADLREWLDNPERLALGLANYTDDRTHEIELLRSQIETLDAAIEKHTTRQDRLIDLFIDGGFDRETLDARRIEIEGTLERLETQRAEIAQDIARMQTKGERAASLAAFGAQIRPKLAYADQDFETRQRIVEILDLKAILTLEEERKAVHAQCHVDGEQLFTVHFTE